MKKTIVFIFTILFSFCLHAQKVTNWHASKTLLYATNYDFDLNKPTGLPIRDQFSFKIDIGYDGVGKIYFLSNGAYYGNGQKLVYIIDYATYEHFDDGKKFIDIRAHNEYANFTFNVFLKKKKEQIIKIATINKTNDGTLYY